MLKLLEFMDVDSRNYNYVGDLAFKRDVVDSDEYKSLSKKIEKLKFKSLISGDSGFIVDFDY